MEDTQPSHTTAVISMFTARHMLSCSGYFPTTHGRGCFKLAPTTWKRPDPSSDNFSVYCHSCAQDLKYPHGSMRNAGTVSVEYKVSPKTIRDIWNRCDFFRTLHCYAVLYRKVMEAPVWSYPRSRTAHAATHAHFLGQIFLLKHVENISQVLLGQSYKAPVDGYRTGKLQGQLS
jgi:hypothetical protein